MISNAQAINAALNDLEELLKVNFHNQLVGFFTGKIQGAYSRAEVYIKNPAGQIPQEELDGFGDRFLSAKTKLAAFIKSKVDGVIIDLELDGDASKALEWLEVAKGIGALEGNEYKKYEAARERFKSYDKAKKDYQERIIELKIARDGLDKRAAVQSSVIKLNAEKTIQDLQETRAWFLTFLKPEDARIRELTNWVLEIREAYEPFLILKSIIDSLTEANKYEEAWKYLCQARDLNFPLVSYFTNPEKLDDLDKNEMTPDKAVQTCESRWRQYSTGKFKEYIKHFNSFIRDEEKCVFNKDPRQLLTDFEKRTQRVLRPVEELGQDTKNEYDQFMEKLRSAIELTKKYDEKLNAINLVNARLGSLGELDQIKPHLEEKTPYLLEKWDQLKKDLTDILYKDQIKILGELKIKFGIDIMGTGQDAGKYTRELEGIQEFKTLKDDFGNLAHLCKSLHHAIELAEDMSTEKASEAIDAIFKDLLEKHSDLPKPSELLDLQQQINFILEPVNESSRLIEQIKECLPSYAKEINSSGEPPNPIETLFQFQDWGGQIKRILGALNILGKSQKPIPGAGKSRRDLEASNNRLIEVEAWTALYVELKKGGADLKKAQGYLNILQNTPRQLIHEDKIQELAGQLGNLEAGDGQVQLVIDRMRNSSNNQQEDFESLLGIWSQFEGIKNMPTTLAAARTQAKSQLSTRLLKESGDFLNKFVQSPRDISPSKVQPVLDWLNSYSGQVDNADLVTSVKSALYEAFAWETFKKQKFVEASAHWLDAETAGRAGARLHRLALIKFLALEKSVVEDYRYLRMANVDSDLKNDVDLRSLSTKIELNEIDGTFQDMDAIREGTEIVKFDKASLGLSNLVSWVPKDLQEDQERDEGFEARLAEVWVEDGFSALIIDRNIKFPSAQLVIQESKYRPAVYNSLSAVFRRVSTEASLADLHLARTAAESLVAKKTWDSNAQQLLAQYPELKNLFADKWRDYRQSVVNNL